MLIPNLSYSLDSILRYFMEKKKRLMKNYSIDTSKQMDLQINFQQIRKPYYKRWGCVITKQNKKLIVSTPQHWIWRKIFGFSASSQAANYAFSSSCRTVYLSFELDHVLHRNRTCNSACSAFEKKKYKTNDKLKFE